ncbi:MAG TPA: hypothetical protein VNA04_03950 [Thermoanaerobaculia bacterium]|nr:hypothetical protein [Thermoanaerobaculia bacterium]
MSLEHEVRAALRPKSPPAGFAEQVVARARWSAGGVRAPRPFHAWRAVAAALTMTAILGGWAAREAAQQRAEGERVRREVLTALRITSDKLRAAQQHVQQIGASDEYE